MAIEIRIMGEPVRTTEQQHRFGGVGRNGKAIVYRDTNLEAARQELLTELLPYRPKMPLTGPVRLSVWWHFGTPDRKKQDAYWKVTRPDTDNMIKLLKDCLTQVGFWKDDSQVASECLHKTWTIPTEANTFIKIEELEPYD